MTNLVCCGEQCACGCHNISGGIIARTNHVTICEIIDLGLVLLANRRVALRSEEQFNHSRCAASWNVGVRVASRVRKLRTEKQARCGSTARVAMLYRSAMSAGWNCDRGYRDRVAGLIARSVAACVKSL